MAGQPIDVRHLRLQNSIKHLLTFGGQFRSVWLVRASSKSYPMARARDYSAPVMNATSATCSAVVGWSLRAVPRRGTRHQFPPPALSRTAITRKPTFRLGGSRRLRPTAPSRLDHLAERGRHFPIEQRRPRDRTDELGLVRRQEVGVATEGMTPKVVQGPKGEERPRTLLGHREVD
jgi:hypothetical protein